MAYLYKRMKKQVSYDNGKTWVDTDPLEYIIGELIDDNSDCVPENTETMDVKLESDEVK